MQNLLTELPPDVAAQLLRHLPQIADAMQERVRQDAKFGPQDRPPVEWFLILSEEVGEVAKECVEIQFNDAAHPYANLANYRKELVETVAVGLAALLNFDTRAAALPELPNNGKLAGVLSGEIVRVLDLVSLYESIPNGNFAVSFMKADIVKGRAALQSRNLADMTAVIKDLQGYSE